ncbi:hypothetical protein [Saccharopolyspora sp. CA-218241]|uniref:hypothetical protein n=1 Tax=Saccharopolyspora sp. CA-218241 TaxID=3240027 RepID=UPI003D961D26
MRSLAGVAESVDEVELEVERIPALGDVPITSVGGDLQGTFLDDGVLAPTGLVRNELTRVHAELLIARGLGDLRLTLPLSEEN